MTAAAKAVYLFDHAALYTVYVLVFMCTSAGAPLLRPSAAACHLPQPYSTNSNSNDSSSNIVAAAAAVVAVAVAPTITAVVSVETVHFRAVVLTVNCATAQSPKMLTVASSTTVQHRATALFKGSVVYLSIVEALLLCSYRTKYQYSKHAHASKPSYDIWVPPSRYLQTRCIHQTYAAAQQR
eukprot:12923-Heterococcus_DN1.PRE.2